MAHKRRGTFALVASTFQWLARYLGMFSLFILLHSLTFSFHLIYSHIHLALELL